MILGVCPIKKLKKCEHLGKAAPTPEGKAREGKASHTRARTYVRTYTNAVTKCPISLTHHP